MHSFLLTICSLVTLYETVQPEMNEVIQAGKSQNQDMCVVPVEVSSICLKIAWSPINARNRVSDEGASVDP